MLQATVRLLSNATVDAVLGAISRLDQLADGELLTLF
jgi:hypothetical protein